MTAVHGVQYLYDEWVQGVAAPMDNTTTASVVRVTAPLVQLERSNVLGGKSWRAGLSMRKVIAGRKPPIFAIIRRINGHPIKQPAAGASSGRGSSSAGSSSGGSSTGNNNSSSSGGGGSCANRSSNLSGNEPVQCFPTMSYEEALQDVERLAR